MLSKLRKILLRLFFFILLFVVLAEVALRLMGHQAWNPPQRSLRVVQPGGHFFQKDSLMGYVMRPGEFAVRMDDQLDFHANHGPDRYRLTAQGPYTLRRPEIWIFGCSFTYGWGVNDEESYPWVLQEMLPAYKIRNFGVSGYGSYQNLLEMERLLAAGQKPSLVVLAYGSFHEQRNTCNRFWRKAIASQEVIQGLEYPYVRFDAKGYLERGYMPLTYSPVPLSGLLALANYLDTQFCFWEEEELQSVDVTWQLIWTFEKNCQKAGAPFLLAGIWKEAGTEQMLQRAAEAGIHQMDISEDLQDPAYRIMPEDAHPNGLIHQRYAASLLPRIQQLLQP